MRTTLNIDEVLMKKLLTTTQVKSKTKAISIAIEDYLKKHQIEKNSFLSGKIRHKGQLATT